MGKILQFTFCYNSRSLEPVWAGYETEYPACFRCQAYEKDVQWTFFELPGIRKKLPVAGSVGQPVNRHFLSCWHNNI